MARNSQLESTGNGASSTVSSDGQHEAVIVLDECLGIAETAKLYNRIMMLTSQGHDVILDCSQVSVIDTTILQMVVPYVWQTNQNGPNVAWRHPSAAFCMTTELLGLEKLVGLESASA